MNLLFLSPACAPCISQEGQITTLAANGAVYVMFGVLAFVFTCFTAVAVAFIRRAKRYGDAVEAELS